jgi:Dolichyl-phosphate-mannose-protein mannosyltransferase
VSATAVGSRHLQTEHPHARASATRWRVLAIAVVILAGLLAKEPELLLPMGPDQGTYSYVAERILDGGLPYVDAWDNKPPATYYLHAAAVALVPAGVRWTGSCIPGTTQPCGYVALQLLDIVWTGATALALVALVHALAFDGIATFASLLLFAVFANLSQLSKEGPTPEKQLLLPMVLAYLAAAKGRPGLAGLAAGVAFLFKQTAISIPVALLLWCVWDRRRLRTSEALTFVAAFCGPLVLTGVYFAARGGLSALWDATFAYNLAQAGSSFWRIPYGFLSGSWHVFAESSALLWLLGLGGAMLVLATGQRRLLVCWAAADVLSLFLGGSKFAQVYYVQLVPSLALLGGLALAMGWRAMRGWARAYAAVVLATLFVLSNQFQASVALRAWNERTPGRSSTSFEQLLALRVAQESAGPVFVWGDNSEIYLWAGRRAPERFFQTFALSRVYADRGYLQHRTELLQTFQNSPPGIVAIDPATARDDPDGSQGLNISTFPELRAFLAEHYVGLDNIGGGWQAYKLR